MTMFKGQTIPLNYHYKVLPSGLDFDVAFVHGNLASANWWLPLLKVWPKAQTQTGKGRIFLLEFLGCGQSQAPRGLEDVNLLSFAKDFNALLKAEHFNGGVVGHSTGGLIAALMLAESPELFKGGFALDPVGAKGVTFDPAMTQAFEAMKADQGLTAAVIGSTIKGLNPEDEFFKNTIVPDAYLAVKQVGDLVLRAISGLNVEAQIKSVSQPLWVTHGQEDVLLPKADSVAMAALCAQGSFFEIPGAGHCLNYENPELLAEWLDKWLKALS